MDDNIKKGEHLTKGMNGWFGFFRNTFVKAPKSKELDLME